MKRTAIEEGTWVKFLNDTKVLLGRVEKKREEEPFSKNNFWVKSKDGYYYSPYPDEIFFAFPKIVFKERLSKVNPSLRTQEES